ncbi:MAG: hypothetical protein GEV03_10555 [Streptosporangiales bacterium]|nr:hypothetical protein [Streptosporangiales bacterium]
MAAESASPRLRRHAGVLRRLRGLATRPRRRNPLRRHQPARKPTTGGLRVRLPVCHRRNARRSAPPGQRGGAVGVAAMAGHLAARPLRTAARRRRFGGRAQQELVVGLPPRHPDASRDRPRGGRDAHRGRRNRPVRPVARPIVRIRLPVRGPDPTHRPHLPDQRGRRATTDGPGARAAAHRADRAPRPRRNLRRRSAEEVALMSSGGRQVRWCYFKIYLEPRVQNQFLQSLRDALARREYRAALKQWFYVRYSDYDALPAGAELPAPGSDAVWRGDHIRLRLLCPAETVPVWESEIHACLARAAYPARLEHADYEPEVARYGGPAGLEIAHAIFSVDSSVAISLLTRVTTNPVVAVVSSCALLVDLGLDIEELDQVYREHTTWITQQLRLPGQDQPGLLAAADRKLERQHEPFTRAKEITGRPPDSNCLAYLGAHLREANNDGLLSRPLPEICLDLQHMHLNRLGMTPRQELSAVVLGAAALRQRLLP